MKHPTNNDFVIVNKNNLYEIFRGSILREDDKEILDDFFEHLNGIIWNEEEKSYVNISTFSFQLFILIENLFTLIIEKEKIDVMHKTRGRSKFPHKDFIMFFYSEKISLDFLKLRNISKHKIDKEISEIFNYNNYFTNQKNKESLKNEVIDPDNQLSIMSSIPKDLRNSLAHQYWVGLVSKYSSEKGIIDLYIISRILLNYFSQ